MITNKQKDFLNKLIHFYGKEPLPSYDAISNDLGLKSKNSVWQYFNKLKEEGLIKMKNHRHFLANELFGISYFEEGVKAGFPSPAEGYDLKKISFDEMLIQNINSTFTIRVSGDSMIDAGIYENDIVIIDKSISAHNGDIVIAIVDGEFTLKYYTKQKNKIILEPANVNYLPIQAKEQLEILGVMVGLVRQLKR